MNGIIGTTILYANPRDVSPSGGMTNIWLGDADMPIVTEKKCSRCGWVKPISEFQKRRTINSKPSKLCESCREITRRWASNNKASNHKWQDENREKANASKKKWRLENPDIQKNAKIAWYALNKERTATVTKIWKLLNPEKLKEYEINYVTNNREKVYQKARNRRARKKLAIGKITAKEWQELCNKYGNKCLCCGRSDVRLTQDHVVPLVLGGTNTIENAQPLCLSCNSKKGVKVVDYR